MKEKSNSLASGLVSCLLAIVQGVSAVIPVAVICFMVQPVAHANSQSEVAGESRQPRKTSLPLKQDPIPALPKFSDSPASGDFFAVHLFPMALVPIGTPTAAENRALASALESYVQRTNVEDQSILMDYLSQFPNSAWKPALLVNLGIMWRQSGYFSRAMDVWQEAWNLSKNATDIRGRALADRAVAELAEVNAWVGRYETLEPLLKSIGNRRLVGGAAEMLAEARDGLHIMEHKPDSGFLCGPFALQQILAATHGNALVKPIYNAKSPTNGFSLAQLKTLSDEAGMKYQIAYRTPGSRVLTNAVVHWKLNHYGAVLEENHGHYLIRDSTFSRLYARDLWVSKTVLDEESDGYFLVPEGELPPGWRTVSSAEAQSVRGRGAPEGRDPNAFTPKDVKSCPLHNSHGMPRYSMHLMLVSLNIVDTPLSYEPPIGPSVDFKITYNQRDPYSQAVANYSNLGPGWTCDWFTYITDNGSSGLRTSVNRYVSGGGVVTHTLSVPATGLYESDRDGNVLQYDAAQDTYTLTSPDGSQEIFGLAISMGSTRNLYIISQSYPNGQKVTFHYDSKGRLDEVVDALGQTTTLSYERFDNPYLITKVEDPFGRVASLQYGQNERLTKITDEIGMISSFTYDSGDFIQQMTTPYGVTTFSYGDGGSSDTKGMVARWLKATDPAGEQEYAYSPDTTTGDPDVPDTDECPTQPTFATYLPSFGNGNLEYRNTLYFDRNAMATVGNGSAANATIYHWLHDDEIAGTVSTSGILESIKPPLESRIWFLYQHQSDPTVSGGIEFRRPSVIARTVDDPNNPGSPLSQYYQFQYNSIGNVTNYIDPLNRQTSYTYYANEIDLHQITQTTTTAKDVIGTFGSYNSEHRPATYTDASGQTYSLFWTASGQLDHLVNPLNQEIQMTYDIDHYLSDVATLDPASGLSLTTAMTYDFYGRPRTLTRASEFTASKENYTLTYDYDNLNRVTKITFPDSTFERFVYDKLNLLAAYDRNGYRTTFTYDPDGRRLTMRDRLNRLTKYSWCGCGSLESITDPMDNMTTWTRDLEGRVKQKTYADQTSTTYTYWPRTSEIQSATDALQQVKEYAYNLDATLAQISYANVVNATPNVNFYYDPSYQRLTKMIDGTGETDYTYEPVGSAGAGQLASEYSAFTLATIEYNYDALGRRIGRSIDDQKESWTFDGIGRLLKHNTALGDFTTEYAGTLRPTRFDYPYGQYLKYNYTDNTHDNHLSEVFKYINAGSDLFQQDIYYNYDTIGRVTSDQYDSYWTGEGPGNSSSLTRNYQSDAEGQLLDVQTVSGNTVTAGYAYNYDAAGNRLNYQTQNGSSQNYSFQMPAGGLTTISAIPVVPYVGAFNNLNQISSLSSQGAMPVRVSGTVNEPASVTVNGQAATVVADPNNSPNGELFNLWITLAEGPQTVPVIATAIGSGTTTKYLYTSISNSGLSRNYSYDLDGNCTGYDSPSVGYKWDAENRLIEIDNGNGTSTGFAYDGLGRRVQIVEVSGGTTNSAKIFVWSGGTLCQERDEINEVTKSFFPEGEQIGGNNYYFALNRQGSVEEMFDDNGLVRAQYTYDPYGNRTKSYGDLDADFGYDGYYIHQASGLDLTLYRAYDPVLGRWLNRDPIQERGGINLYTYVGNNPINAVDPLGLQLADPNAAWAFSPPGDSSGISSGQALGFMTGAIAANALAATGIGLAADYTLAALGLGGAFAETPEGQAELSEAEQGLAQMGKGIVCNSKVVAHAPIEVTSHEQLALRSGTLLQAPLAGTPGQLVEGAEAFTYSMQGQNIFVTGSMNFNSTVSQNTVDVVTFYLKGKQ